MRRSPVVSLVHLRVELPAPPLQPAETDLVHPRATTQRAAELRYGRKAARRALTALGCRVDAVGRGPGGEPLWPQGVVGSLTHAAGHVVAAVAWRRQVGGIGIDLEHEERFFPGLAYQVAYETEASWIGGLQGDRRRRSTLEVFSAKESIYKAFYPRVGRYFGFDAARLTPDEGGFRARLVADLDPEYPPERRFHIGCSWHGTLVFTTLLLPP